MNPIKVAIFASGRGLNAMALIQKAQTLTEKVRICLVLTDQPEAGIIAKSQDRNVPVHIIAKTSDKVHHEKQILEVIRQNKIDWIFLAGYMRLLSADFLMSFSGFVQGASQIVNIHPSLLPAYPGVNSIERAYSEKVEKSGVTIHLVDQGVDTGAILLQEEVILQPHESLIEFENRIHEVEHSLYGRFLYQVSSGERSTCRFL